MNESKDSFFNVQDFHKRAKDFLKLKAASKIDHSGKKQGKKGRLSVQVWGQKDVQDFERLSSRERIDFRPAPAAEVQRLIG